MIATAERLSLTVINLEEARFECVFGRGCEGVCCRNSRPPVYPDEVEAIEAGLDKLLPRLRPEARAVVEKHGFLSGRRKEGLPMLRVVDSWCVFFNQGCVLHRLGVEEGDKHRYKPAVCALFPLAKNDNDEWFVRQAGQPGEKWDLPCLNPGASTVPASESLKEEMQLALKYEAESAALRPG